MNELDILRQVPLFSKMDEQELKQIHSMMRGLTFKQGEVIVREGEIGGDFFVIINGHAETLITDASGTEMMIELVGPGDFFGELSMLTGEPRSARIRASNTLQVLALHQNEFFEFLTHNPQTCIDVLIVIGKRLHKTTILLRKSVSRNVNVMDSESLTLGQRIADGVAATMGSWRFIITQSIVLLFWIGLNITGWIKHWDPYPFILLNLALSFQAAYAAPIIMMSQNRQADKDRLAAEIDHKVNTKAELEIGLLLNRLDDLERNVQHNHREQHTLLQMLQNQPASTHPNTPTPETDAAKK